MHMAGLALKRGKSLVEAPENWKKKKLIKKGPQV